MAQLMNAPGFGLAPPTSRQDIISALLNDYGNSFGGDESPYSFSPIPATFKDLPPPPPGSGETPRSGMSMRFQLRVNENVSYSGARKDSVASPTKIVSRSIERSSKPPSLKLLASNGSTALVEPAPAPPAPEKDLPPPAPASRSALERPLPPPPPPPEKSLRRKSVRRADVDMGNNASKVSLGEFKPAQDEDVESKQKLAPRPATAHESTATKRKPLPGPTLGKRWPSLADLKNGPRGRSAVPKPVPSSHNDDYVQKPSIQEPVHKPNPRSSSGGSPPRSARSGGLRPMFSMINLSSKLPPTPPDDVPMPTGKNAPLPAPPSDPPMRKMLSKMGLPSNPRAKKSMPTLRKNDSKSSVSSTETIKPIRPTTAKRVAGPKSSDPNTMSPEPTPSPKKPDMLAKKAEAALPQLPQAQYRPPPPAKTPAQAQAQAQLLPRTQYQHPRPSHPQQQPQARANPQTLASAIRSGLRSPESPVSPISPLSDGSGSRPSSLEGVVKPQTQTQTQTPQRKPSPRQLYHNNRSQPNLRADVPVSPPYPMFANVRLVPTTYRPPPREDSSTGPSPPPAAAPVTTSTVTAPVPALTPSTVAGAQQQPPIAREQITRESIPKSQQIKTATATTTNSGSNSNSTTRSLEPFPAFDPPTPPTSEQRTPSPPKTSTSAIATAPTATTTAPPTARPFPLAPPATFTPLTRTPITHPVAAIKTSHHTCYTAHSFFSRSQPRLQTTVCMVCGQCAPGSNKFTCSWCLLQLCGECVHELGRVPGRKLDELVLKRGGRNANMNAGANPSVNRNANVTANVNANRSQREESQRRGQGTPRLVVSGPEDEEKKKGGGEYRRK